jgi:tetratricopeptide (TPR) repeat protein
MYDIALRCARKINPEEWSEDRQERLEYGIMENRPYFRALLGRAIALKEMGEIKSAIKAAKKILKWNPNDNQGVRTIVCNWMLQDGDTEGCLNILRSYDELNNSALAYSDVLLQFLRWKKEDVLEEDVQKSLYRALKCNLYIPDLLLQEAIEEKEIEYTDGDGPMEAQQYVQDAHAVWRANTGAIEWLASQKFYGNIKVPRSEMDLITILRKGPVVFVRCKNTDLNGRDEKMSTLRVTQKRDQCRGTALPDFYWPSALNRRAHLAGDAIFMFHYDVGAERVENARDSWRKTTFSEIQEVPFWKILVHFSEEDE